MTWALVVGGRRVVAVVIVTWRVRSVVVLVGFGEGFSGDRAETGVDVAREKPGEDGHGDYVGADREQ